MNDTDDPRCPECGGPIGQTATYCMHCSADLTDEVGIADDGARDGGVAPSTTPRRPADEEDGRLLAPDGLVDDTLTVLAGIVGGVVVGAVGTVVLVVVTGSGWAVVFGLVAWLGATAYLVRRRTVQEAVAKSGYAVAVVLLTVPVIALSPVVDVDGGVGQRSGLFLVLLVFVAVPAAVAAVVGWVASQFVPADERGSDG